jgi:hypothetical protein
MSVVVPFDQAVDVPRGRRYVNADPSVVHGRQAALYLTKIAMEARGIDGPVLLMEAMEEASYLALKWIFLGTESDAQDRKAQVEEHFRLSGLGRIAILSVGLEGGRAEMARPWLEEGWAERWGKAPQAVGLIVCGYLAGAFAAMTGLGLRSFAVEQSRSTAEGDSACRFHIAPRR